jgi:hypothetical protein
VLHADGVVLLGSTDGYFLGDPRFDALMHELDRRKAVVFVHPNLHKTSMELHLSAPGFLVEFVCDTTRAATNLILTGTLEKYPRIRWILAHAGGFLPFIAWRLSLASGLPGIYGEGTQGHPALHSQLLLRHCVVALSVSDGRAARARGTRAHPVRQRLSLRARRNVLQLSCRTITTKSFDRLAAEHFDAAYIAADPLTNQNLMRVIELALRHKLPAIGEGPGLARLGLLLGYGPGLQPGRGALSMWTKYYAVPSQVNFPSSRQLKLSCGFHVSPAGYLLLSVVR